MEKISIGVPCDLSHTAYEDAMYLAAKHVDRDVWYRDDHLLKVSLWDCDKALEIMSKYKNCDVKVTGNFRRSEWSFIPCSTQDIEIYSPGA